MEYIVYLTRNKKSSVNGLNRIYVGVHKTENPEVFDGYIGENVYIQEPATYMYPKTPFQVAVKKYGVDAFERVTLYVYRTKEEAMQKFSEIVDEKFIQQSHTYNSYLGKGWDMYNQTISQYSPEGIFIKDWALIQAANFYGYSIERFLHAIHGKHPLVGTLWCFSEGELNLEDDDYKSWGAAEYTHLYNKDGKWITSYAYFKQCAARLCITTDELKQHIQKELPVKDSYYVSKTLSDLFIPKIRNQYHKTTLFIYDSNSKFLGYGIGKEIMPLINTHSWKTIDNAIRYKNGWYKDFYISLKYVSHVPVRTQYKSSVDVYDKYGNFIETLDTLKQVKEKYNVPSSKIKNLEQGQKYYGDYIFKYKRKLGK